MERITSRKNPLYLHLRRLAADGAYREHCGQFVCTGGKMLQEALQRGMQVQLAAFAPGADGAPTADCGQAVEMPSELLAAAMQVKSPPDVVFVCSIPERQPLPLRGRHLLLENLQDPGNVGTIVRTANAFGAASVLLAGACADPFSPKAARATMGAIFSLPVCRLTDAEVERLTLPLYAAALSPDAVDIRAVQAPPDCLIAVGTEGHGLSASLLSRAAGLWQIPMLGACESLNAAVAAAVILWELHRAEGTERGLR